MARTSTVRTPTSGAERAARALALAAALAVAPALAQKVPVDTLALEMDPVDADVLFKKYKYDTSSFPVAIVEPGGRRITGRIEVKGESSRLVDKKGPLIKLDPGMTWQGQSRLSFNALSTDPSMMREWLAWDLIHALGMVAPQVRYTNISINGQSSGLFLRIEWIGKDMFKRYGHAEGELYDPIDLTSCANLGIESVTTLERCWAKLLPRDDPGFASLEKLVRALDAEPVATFDAWLDRDFHAQSVIDWIAVTVVVENLTTYNNEYWPYFSRTTGRWLIVPWDYDRSLGKNADPWQPYPGFVFNDNFQYYYPLWLGASNPLRDKAFKNERVLRKIKARIAEIVDGTPDRARPWRGWFNERRMDERMMRIEKTITPYVERDPYMAPRAQEIRDEREALRHFAHARARYLRRTVLAPSDWVRDIASGPLAAPGATTYLTDGEGFMLAQLDVRQRSEPGRVEASVLRRRPELVPPGLERDACVQRTWFLSSQAAADAAITVEYLQEFQRTSEVGKAVSSERALSLFVRDATGWWRLPTRASPLANTLSSPSLRIRAGERLRLVACEAPAVAAAP